MAEDFAAIADEVRAGLGEIGLSLTIIKSAAVEADPSEPWEIKPTATISETVSQFGEGSGSFRSGETVITADYEFMTSVPKTLAAEPGDLIKAGDGDLCATVLRVERFPPTGQAAYLTIWANK